MNPKRAALSCACLLVSAPAYAQSMDHVFLEMVVASGVNVTYTLDDAQFAEMSDLVAEISAQAGYPMTPTRLVILYYIDAWNVRAPRDACQGADDGCDNNGLIGNGRTQWISFLAVVNTASPAGLEIIDLHTIASNPNLETYYESQGVEGHISVVEDITARWTSESAPGVDTRSLKLRVNGDEGKLRLDVDGMPLVFPNGAGPLAPTGVPGAPTTGVDFIGRPLGTDDATRAQGIEISVEQFNICQTASPPVPSALGACTDAALYDGLDFDDTISRLSIPVTVGDVTTDVNRFFPAHAGVARIRTEARFMRFWDQD